MARTNVKHEREKVFTHGGAPASPHLTPMQALRRSVASCFLWENEFYEDGKSISARIWDLAGQVPVKDLCKLAIEARQTMMLRHTPLWLAVRAVGRAHELKDTDRHWVADAVAGSIRRTDEISEIVKLYWDKNPLAVPRGNGRHFKQGKMIPHQMAVGLREAFNRFDRYQFGKYDFEKGQDVKLTDVMKLVRPVPKDETQAKLLLDLKNKAIEAPDTWETALMRGADKRETFTRLLETEKLDYLALLRNLRNMVKSGVDKELVEGAIRARRGAWKVFPFRYIAAAKAAPDFEEAIDEAFVGAMADRVKLPGRTLLVIDVSGSMYGAGNISKWSDMTRVHAACALGAIAREVCEKSAIYATAGSDFHRRHQTEKVPNRHGMALADAIYGSRENLGGGGIFLTQVCDYLRQIEKGEFDRMIVFTDEQDCENDPNKSPLVAKPLGKINYLVNVASAKNGISYDKTKWVHVDGFSEAMVHWIGVYEASMLNQVED